MNRDRKKLIDRLRTTKDPGERDRIMWALSGLEKDAAHHKSTPSEPRKTEPRKTETGAPAAEKENLPAMPTGIRKFVSYLAPGLCMIIGFSNIIEVLMQIIETGRDNANIPKLVMGIVFFVFGLSVFLKGKRKIAGTEPEAK